MVKVLVSANAIANLYEKTLKTWGFSVERDRSRLSNSAYIRAWLPSENYEDDENDDDWKEEIIRFSDHDLPPSYDGLHGFHTMDVATGKKDRVGNVGNAVGYLYGLYKLSYKYDKPIPKTITSLENRLKKESEEKAAAEAAYKVKCAELAKEKAKKFTELLNWSKLNVPETYNTYIDNKEKAADSTRGNSKKRAPFRYAANCAERKMIESWKLSMEANNE
jgi:hypothetical protein